MIPETDCLSGYEQHTSPATCAQQQEQTNSTNFIARRGRIVVKTREHQDNNLKEQSNEFYFAENFQIF